MIPGEVDDVCPEEVDKEIGLCAESRRLHLPVLVPTDAGTEVGAALATLDEADVERVPKEEEEEDVDKAGDEVDG